MFFFFLMFRKLSTFFLDYQQWMVCDSCRCKKIEVRSTVSIFVPGSSGHQIPTQMITSGLVEGVLLEADDVIEVGEVIEAVVEVDNDQTQPVIVDRAEIVIFREELSSDVS